jgi:nickel/cobalt transporter (NicO) family protein
MPVTRLRLCSGPGRLLLTAAMLAAAIAPALAQSRNPFSVGISEGGGVATGWTGWLLAQQGWLEHQLALGVKAAKLGTAGIWPLAALSFVYGIFHAAGPGHGKAVLASYMVANERALRRGVSLSFAAAVLQGLVAVVLISLLTLVLHATAQHIKTTASWIETASFLTVVGLGAQLVWRKGRALLRVWGAKKVTTAWLGGGGAIFAAPAASTARLMAPGVGVVAIPAAQVRASSFVCAPAEAAHPDDCRHCVGPDPSEMAGERFDWRQASITVLAAGLRPCSGAILVLVFAVAQGCFAAGAVSVAAMSLGVAITTSVLASCAVLFKAVAGRFVGRRSDTAMIVGAGVEFAAACVVLAAGLLLLTGYALTGLS